MQRVMMSRILLMTLALLGWTMVALPAQAADPEPQTLTIKDHKFAPAELEIPSGVRVRLIIRNDDATPEEFESKDLRIEKVIPGKTETSVFVGPLKPGIYKFVGEFHEATAQGRIVVK
jgi:plastocyanin